MDDPPWLATASMTVKPKWTLWRQDDNGSSAVIGRDLDRRDAERRLRELEARGHKQHYWIEPGSAGAAPRVNLVVIRSRDIEASKGFYELLGLSFTRHRHRGGADHYACEFPSLVFEIYPDRGAPSTGVRIGFSVPAVERVVETLRAAGSQVVAEPSASPWGWRAVVRDPDGHSVELTEPGGADGAVEHAGCLEGGAGMGSAPADDLGSDVWT